MTRLFVRGRRFAVVIGLLGLLGLSIAPSVGEAHTRSATYVRWQVDGGHARATAQVSELDLSVLAAASIEAQAELPALVRLSGPSGPCRPTGPARELHRLDGARRYAWDVQCADPRPERVSSELLFDLVAAHVTYVRVETGEAVTEGVLTEARRARALAAARPTRGGVVEFFEAGLGHILGGFDHLVFLVALLAAALGGRRRMRPVLGAVTGFTIGHALTLGLVATGALTPKPGPVEVLIGLSIVFAALHGLAVNGSAQGVSRDASLALGVGLLACGLALCGPRLALAPVLGISLFGVGHVLVRRTPSGWGPIGLAGVFGLLHGLGFAGGLRALCPEGPIGWPALLGFNLGVEAGQLGLVLLAWPLTRRAGPGVRRLACVGAAGLGAYWTVARALSSGM